MPLDAHKPSYDLNNEETVHKVRLGKKVDQTIKKLKQHPAAKDVAKWSLILGLAGLTVLGAKGIKKISSSIQDTRTKVASILKEKNQEEAFRRFCYDQKNPALRFLMEQHDSYIHWTQFSVPEATYVLSKAGIVLNSNLEEIPPKDTIDRVLSYLSKEPISDAEIKEAWKTIAEWKKEKSELEAAEQQFQMLKVLFTAGKSNEIQKMLGDPEEKIAFPKPNKPSRSHNQHIYKS
jgi:hypothetical protein